MLGLLERGSEKRELDATLRRSHGEEQAAKYSRAGLALWGLTEQSLGSLKKNDQRKLAIARLIRRRTTVPNEWIARSLHLGHVRRVSRCWTQRNALTAELEGAV